MKDTAHSIGGARVEPKRRFLGDSPIDGARLADVNAAAAAEVNDAAPRLGRTWNLHFFCDVKNIATWTGSFA